MLQRKTNPNEKDGRATDAGSFTIYYRLEWMMQWQIATGAQVELKPGDAQNSYYCT